MGSLEDFPAKESPPALSLTPSSVDIEMDHKGSILVENGEGNLEINSREDENLEGENQKMSKIEHPFRPHAKDCSFYLRTGMCDFGLCCMYNHPVKKQGKEKKIEWIPVMRKEEAEIKEEEEENEKDMLTKQTGPIECKYYLSAGGCKYGKNCRYGHFKHVKKSDVPQTELNFLGLPIKTEKVFSFYNNYAD